MSIELQAELNAAKQMYNIMADKCLQLHTNLNINNANLIEANKKIEQYEKDIEMYKNTILSRDDEILKYKASLEEPENNV